MVDEANLARPVTTVQGDRTTSIARDWSLSGTWLCRLMSWSAVGLTSHEDLSGV